MSATLITILGSIGAAVAAVLFAFLKGKSAGRDSVAAEQARKDDATRKEFDRIDSAAPDLDSSLDRLRDRAGRNKPKAG